MSYFVPEFDASARDAVVTIAREDHDPEDQWGWAMSWLFDIAAELDLRGEDVPPELQYRPGAFGSEVSEDRAPFMGEFSVEGLTYAALLFNRFCDLLKRHGHDY